MADESAAAQLRVASLLELGRWGPDDPQAHYWRTAVLLAMGRPAWESAQRAVDLAPHNPYAWYLLSRAHSHNAGSATLAQNAAENALRTSNGRAIGHHALGLLYLDRRQWDKAEREYRDALTLEPTSPDLLNNLGMALLHRGDAKGAVDQFVSAGALNPGDSGLYRRNAAAAGEAYIHKPHAKLRRQAGLAFGGAFLVLVIAFASGGVTVGLALTATVVVAAILTDRIRLHRLPTAARLAVQSRRRERRKSWRSPQRWTARQWRRAIILTVVGGYLIAIGVGSTAHRPHLTKPDDSAACVLARAGLALDAQGAKITPERLGCPKS